MAAWPNTAFIPLPLHLRAGPITCVPLVGFSIGAVASKVGGGSPQVIAYVVARALFAFQRMILWEIPFMPARFVWFRAAVSLPFPFLAAAIAMVIGKP